MTRNVLLYLFFILSNCVLLAQAEKNVDHQKLVWMRYYNHLELSEKWSIHSEFDNRIFIDSIEQNLFVIRTQGRYKISNPVEVGAGGAYFSVATQDPNVESTFNKPEYRLQQDLTLRQDLGKINLSHRYQVEERFFRNYDSNGLKSGSSFAMRFRYKIQGESTLWKNEKQALRGILADEIMVNAGNKIVKNTFDQNRIYAALRYRFDKNFAVEAGYMNSYQQRSSGVDYYSRNIIRISLFHTIKLYGRS